MDRVCRVIRALVIHSDRACRMRNIPLNQPSVHATAIKLAEQGIAKVITPDARTYLPLRAELRGTGVSASVVCPGFVSEAGMFAERSQRAPRLLGTSTPEAVAGAVVRAVVKDVGEIIVNPGPIRLMLALEALSPRLSDWILRHSGVYDYYRGQAEAEAAASSPEQP